MSEAEGFKSGFVALVGRPNVGKSTLMNAFLREKVAVVSPRPQTTRTRIHGILNGEGHQVVFVDTPGVCDNRNALRKAMRAVGGNAAADSDVTLLIVEARRGEPRVAPEERHLIEAARGNPGGTLLVALNKVDALRDKADMLPWIEVYAQASEADAIIPISALREDGLQSLLDEILARLPDGPPLFPTDMHTDQAERTMCEELIRVQLLLQLREEVPHSAAVVIEQFDESEREDDGGLVHLEGRIYIERESQRGIVIGKKGSRIKAVSTAARHDIEELLGCKVYLRLAVHVDPHWTNKARAVQNYGIGVEG